MKSLSIGYVAAAAIICVALVGSTAAHGNLTATRPISLISAIAKGDSPTACDHSPNVWHIVRIFDYQPRSRAYMVLWEFCADGIGGQRVRVTDDTLKKSLVEYRDDEILRVEKIDLLGNQAYELLVLTGSAGTADTITWHLLSEVDGELREWKYPDYDVPANKLLRADEDFCCKDWGFHLRANSILLSRGTYRKGEANCCPSRGGVLVELSPVRNALKLTKIQRVSKAEYYRLRTLPFCWHCVLSTP